MRLFSLVSEFITFSFRVFLDLTSSWPCICRIMAVLDPLKVTITNFPADHPGTLTIPNFPADESKGFHNIPYSKTLFIEKSDFREVSYFKECWFIFQFYLLNYVHFYSCKRFIVTYLFILQNTTFLVYVLISQYIVFIHENFTF